MAGRSVLTTSQIFEVIPGGSCCAYIRLNINVTPSTANPQNILHQGLRSLISPLALVSELTYIRIRKSTSSITSEIDVPATVPVSHPFCCTPGREIHPSPLLELISIGCTWHSPSRT